jgi:excisionase family DNA binding protein
MDAIGPGLAVQADRRLDAREFLDAAQLAQLLGVSRRTAYRWIHDGEVPSARVGGVRRVRRSDLDALFDRKAK